MGVDESRNHSHSLAINNSVFSSLPQGPDLNYQPILNSDGYVRNYSALGVLCYDPVTALK